MPHHEDNSFSSPAETLDFAALLFDMDGTIGTNTEKDHSLPRRTLTMLYTSSFHLPSCGKDSPLQKGRVMQSPPPMGEVFSNDSVRTRMSLRLTQCTQIDSTPAIVKYWRETGKEIGVDGDVILETSHGRRSIDVLKLLCPERANWEYVCAAEGRIPKLHGSDATEIPGSRALLSSLESASAPWAIVTSGTRPLVTGWLDVMSLAHPRFLVSAEDVANGKPDPACYRLGAERLGLQDVEPERLLVLEDAPAGVRAGKAAGCRVCALATTHGVQVLREAGADWIVRDMRSVVFEGVGGKGRGVKVRIEDALV